MPDRQQQRESLPTTIETSPTIAVMRDTAESARSPRFAATSLVDDPERGTHGAGWATIRD